MAAWRGDGRRQVEMSKDTLHMSTPHNAPATQMAYGTYIHIHSAFPTAVKGNIKNIRVATLIFVNKIILVNMTL